MAVFQGPHPVGATQLRIDLAQYMVGSMKSRNCFEVRWNRVEFAAQLGDWLESVRTSYGSRALPFDEASARRRGRLHAELG